MAITQFQDESVSAKVSGARFSQSSAAVSQVGSQGVTNPAAVEAVLLGIHLRGWLADSEKEFLDNLSPDKSVTFLIHGKRYLHPEDIELFPFDVIQSATQQGGKALFLHRYQPEGSDAGGYVISTAVINPSEPKPLVLGYLGPHGEVTQPEIQQRFISLVAQFRETYSLVSQIARELTERQEPEVPTIIVNRCSGRVLAINEAAEKLLCKSQRSLVDREFGQLKTRLGSILVGRAMKMTNISRKNFHLTIITIPSRLISSEPEVDDVPAFLIEGLRNKLAGVTVAAQRLSAVSQKIVGKEITTLSQTIVEAAGELDLYVNKLDLLCRYDRLVPVRTDLREELRQAVTTVVPQLDRKRRIEIADDAARLEVWAPHEAFKHLCESILLSHLLELDSPGSTNVSFKGRSSEGRMVIAFETDTFPALAENTMNLEWFSFARKLAARMGVRLVNRRSAQNYKLITGMTINL